MKCDRKGCEADATHRIDLPATEKRNKPALALCNPHLAENKRSFSMHPDARVTAIA